MSLLAALLKFLVILLVAIPVMAQPKPALVSDVGEPGRNPYQTSAAIVSTACDLGGAQCVLNFNDPSQVVPAGKRLVLTMISVAANVTAGSTTSGSAQIAPSSGSSAALMFPLAIEGPYRYQTAAIVLYVDAGAYPIVVMNSPLGGQFAGFVSVSLVGYLVSI